MADLEESDTVEIDPLNLNTYQWAEWTIFIIIILAFGCICLCIGICIQNYRLRDLLMTEDNIGNWEDPQKRVTFRSHMKSIISPPRSSKKKSGKMSSKPEKRISGFDSSVQLGSPPSHPSAIYTPSLTATQIKNIGLVGQSVQKVPMIALADEEEDFV